MSLYELVEAGILSEVKVNGGRDIAYQPGVDVSMLTVEYVVSSLEKKGKADVPVGKTEVLAKLSGCLNTFAEDVKKSPANILLKDI